MVTIIPVRFKKLWDEWILRAAILFSLSLQIFLILSASSRKYRVARKLTILIWITYLLADWIAAFAVGLISNGLGSDCPDDFSVNKGLAAFWAPFLLLHLGGPDAITAFSLEDNELWIRHLFGLLIQLIAVVYVFLQSLPNDFYIPTLLVLISGTIKYAERTRALYVACLGNFKESLLPKPDAGPNYAQLMEEYSSKKAAHVPVSIITVKETNEGSKDSDKRDEEISDQEISPYSDVVQEAFKFYRTFRGLIVDHMLSFQDRDNSREFFFGNTIADGFRVMEAELNFMYDELFTKMAVVHNTGWRLLHFICSALVVVALWHFASHRKHEVHKFDISVTYMLLIGGLVLEIISHFHLMFSDWTIAVFRNSKAARIVCLLCEQLSYNKTRRWSNTVSQHSLMYYCLNQRLKWRQKILELLGAKSVLDELKYKKTIPLDVELKNFIFKEIRQKAKEAETIQSAKEICSSRGELTLLDYPSHEEHKLIAGSVSEDVDFDESLLLWHVATELCYYEETDNTNHNRVTNDRNSNKELCKLLSDYMLYLLLMRPTLMSSVAGIAQIRFQDTCEEAKKFLSRGQMQRGFLPKFNTGFKRLLSGFETEKIKNACAGLLKLNSVVGPSNARGNESIWVSYDAEIRKACKKLLDVNTAAKPSKVKGDRSKSVLFDACMLAKELKELDERKMWEMMSRLWVELLCYAASHCRPNGHAQQLSKGGELVTFVWLGMAHFGLGDQFRVLAGHARAKLIGGK